MFGISNVQMGFCRAWKHGTVRPGTSSTPEESRTMTEYVPLSRRRLLATATALAATPALTALPLAAPAGAATAPSEPLPAPATWKARPFPLDAVDLGPGVFRDKRDLMLEYARAYPADRILAVFRANAGLDTRGAQPRAAGRPRTATCAATTRGTSSPSSPRRTRAPVTPSSATNWTTSSVPSVNARRPWPRPAPAATPGSSPPTRKPSSSCWSGTRRIPPSGRRTTPATRS